MARASCGGGKMKGKINEFPNIDVSKFNIDENGNVLRGKRITDNTKTLYNAMDKTKKLEEENEQLKIKIKALESANKAMVKEIDDMSSCGIGILIKITKLKEENRQLKQLIEKMKNCDNCKFKNCGMKEIQKESKLVCEEWESTE